MAQAPENSIIRVINANGKTVGTGFLISDDLAVTCAHVIQMAGNAPGGNIEVAFYCGSPNQKAQILSDGYSSMEEADIAFLRLLEKPEGSELVQLYSAKNSGSHPCRCLGYPGGSEKASWSSDTINGLLNDRTPPILQFQSTRIERGYSGAPVYDEILDGVVGMVSWGHDKNHMVEVHAVTADTIAMLCPQNLVMTEPPERSGKKQKTNLIEWAFLIATIVQAIPAVINLNKAFGGFLGISAFISIGLFFFSLFVVLGWIGFARNKSIRKYRVRVLEQWTISQDIKYSARYSGINRFARAGFGISLAVFLAIAWILYGQARIFESKTVVLVTSLEGPELQNYRVTDLLIDKLKEETQGYGEIQVRALPQSISEIQGSEVARTLGHNYKADFVIWGWYGKTIEKVPVIVHIENINTTSHVFSEVDTKLRMQTKVADLDSFILQEDISDQMSGISLSVAAMTFYERKQYDQALTRFEQAAKLFERSSDYFNGRSSVYFYIGNIHDDQGNLEQAIEDYNLALAADPKDVAAYVNRGLVYHTLGKHEQALQDYNQALAIDPQFALAYNNRGDTYSYLGRNEQAIDDFTQALAIDPYYAKAYYNRGTVENALGQLERAIWDFSQALAINPQYVAAYINRGNAFETQGQHELAIKDYSQALAIDPQFAIAYFNRGCIYYTLGKYEQAIDDFTQALAIEPKKVEFLFNRGSAYHVLNQYELAIEDFTQALAINPNNAGTYNNRGLAYHNLGQYELAIKDFTQALAIDPRLDIAYVNRGTSFAYMSRYEQAIQDFTQALEINPKDAGTFYNRAILFQELGQKEKAANDLREVLKFTHDAQLRRNAEQKLGELSQP